MGVYQDTDKAGVKRWRVDITVKEGEGKKRIRQWVSGTTHEAALYEESLLLQQHGEAPTQPTTPLLKDYYFVFRTWAKQHRKPSYYDGLRKVLEADVLPLLGEYPLHKIDAHAKDAVAARVAQRGCSTTTINNTLGALGAVLKHALDAKILSERPPSRFVKVSTAESKFYTKEELEKLLDAARPDVRWYPVVLLAGDTGLRLGEIRALAWEAVNLKKGWLRVKRALWKRKLGTPKGVEERSVPLRPRVVSALEAIQHERGPWIFCREDGEPFGPEAYSAALRRIAQKAELPSIGWHGLRHTFLTTLCAKRVDIRTIQELAGHAQITTTQRYLHTTEKQLREAIDVLDRD